MTLLRKIAGLLALAPAAVVAQTLASFETTTDLTSTRLRLARATAALTTEGVTDGAHAARITMLPSTLTAVARARFATPVDLSTSGGFAIDLTNPESFVVEVGLIIRDTLNRTRTSYVTLAPGERATIAASTHREMTTGAMYELTYLPNPYPGMRSARLLNITADLTKIDEIGFQVLARPYTVSVIMDNIRPLPYVNMRNLVTGTVDRYGQNAYANYPDKIYTDADLLAQQAKEEAWLATVGRSTRNRFGPYLGWLEGPRFTPTGFFETVFYNGKWWFVTPDGMLFWSTGPTSARRDAPETKVAGNEYKFQWLPTAEDPLSEWVYPDVDHGTVANFYMMNLERKFGVFWKWNWEKYVLDRIPAWGFNTLAYGTDKYFIENGKVPYTIGIMTTRGTASFIYSRYNFNAMPDVFDTRYRTDVATRIAQFAERVKNDPMFLGWYIDNELQFGDRRNRNDTTLLARDIMNRHFTRQPAKRVLVGDLKAKYGTVEALNAAWGRTYTSWAAVEAANVLPATLNATATADLRAFIFKFADTMFQIHREELMKQDPNHLLLGCRFDVWTPEVLQASAKWHDVVSFNAYTADLTTPSFRFPQGYNFFNELGKPVMIGEMHFPGMDRGMYGWGLFPGQTVEGMSPQLWPTQQTRAQQYANYMNSAFTHPSVVGVHWHRYNDDPVGGRPGSGFNSNIGFVSVADVPYWEMILPMRDFNLNLYSNRSAR